MRNKRKNSAAIEQAIAALQVELAASREAEKARKWEELARLLKRTGALDDALAWARSRKAEHDSEAASHG